MSQFFKTRGEVEAWLSKMGVASATINENLTVDVSNNVLLGLTLGADHTEIVRFPVRFSRVSGDFRCEHNKLESLDGVPHHVGGSFYCFCNHLKSLEGGPEVVGDGYYCHDNSIAALSHLPETLKGSFLCRDNRLTSLAGSPKSVGGNFDCSKNLLLSLEGGPSTVVGYYTCAHNSIETLSGAPREIQQYFHCQQNKLQSLSGGPEWVRGGFWCDDNPLTTLLGMPSFIGEQLKSPFSEHDVLDFVRSEFRAGRKSMIKNMHGECLSIESEVLAEMMKEKIGQSQEGRAPARRRSIERS